MTVNANAGYRKDYMGNGATKNWPVPFYFLDATHLQVILTDTSVTPNVSVDLTLNSDFTAAGAGDPTGGSITTTLAYSSVYKITILRNVPLEQDTAYPEGDSFPAASHERALDRLTMIVQQQAEVLNRAVTGNAGSPVSYALPAPQAGYALGWDVNGMAIVNCPNTAADQTALIQSSQQFQPYTNAVTSGSAPAFTASLTPAITAYAEPFEAEIKAHADGTLGSNTINFNGVGALNLKQYSATGAKIPAYIKSGCVYRVRYDGTDAVVLNPSFSPGSLAPQSGARTTGFTLDATHIGRMQILASTGITVTLPTTNSIPSGACFILKNEGTGRATIALNSNTIYDCPSLYIEQGETVVLQSDGGSVYRLVHRSSRSMPDFSNVWTASYSQGTVYQTDTDSLVSVILSGTYMNGIRMLVGPTNNPTYVVHQFGDDLNNNTKNASFMCPLPKGWYFKFDNPNFSSAWETITVNIFRCH